MKPLYIVICFSLFYSCLKTSNVDNIKEETTIEEMGDSIATNAISKQSISLDLEKIKKMFEGSSTSTLLSKNKSKHYYKPQENGYFGKYYFIKDTKKNENSISEHVAQFVVFNTEKEWKYDNKTDIIIEASVYSNDIIVFPGVEIGSNTQKLEQYFGTPYKIYKNEYYIYKERNLITIFKIKDDKIQSYRVGLYNDNVIENLNNNIDTLIELI